MNCQVIFKLIIAYTIFILWRITLIEMILVFQIKALYLKNKKWKNLNAGNSINLFSSPLNPLGTGETIEASTVEPFVNFNVKSINGFLKLSLSGTDFGHKIYPNIYTTEAIKMANPIPTGTLPNAPYTPSIQELSIDYGSEKDFDLDIDQFFSY